MFGPGVPREPRPRRPALRQKWPEWDWPDTSAVLPCRCRPYGIAITGRRPALRPPPGTREMYTPRTSGDYTAHSRCTDLCETPCGVRPRVVPGSPFEAHWKTTWPRLVARRALAR